MCGSFFALLKKDFRLMVSSKFFLLAIGSLILYTCYINFVYVKLDQEIFPVYLYDPAQTQDNVPDNLISVSSLKELQNACEDGYSIGIDLSDGTAKIMMTSCGISKIDNLRHSYAVSKLSSGSAKEALIIGTNNKDMKSRREITAEFLFFELAAVGFLGLAAMLFKEKQMGVVRVHAILPVGKSAFILSKSSSNVTALIFPAFRRTRSAVRRNIFARLTASSSPQNVTLPSSTWTISYPRSVISFFKTASRPKWHGATNSILLICRPFQYPAIRASSHVYLIRSRR